uniref:G_PROTEIN_RECEP_F1_2 domain-containing protein n=1 Tax=Angiostrongylus cantonensis TaxID=6313 RepID=A0A0K0DFU7_ANGCA
LTLLIDLLLSMVGCFGNALVILATMTSARLRNRCGILICILAVADFVICIFLVHVHVMMLSNRYSLRNDECYLYTFYGLFAINIQSGTDLVLSTDRLLAVMNPIKYTLLPVLLYIVMLVGVLIYAIVSVCLPPTAYSGNSRLVWITANFAVSVMVTSIYGLAHVKCRNIKSNKRSMERINRLFNSLSIITAIYTSTWFITVTVLLFMEVTFNARINRQLGWLVVINATMKFFVYYWRAFAIHAGSRRNPPLKALSRLGKMVDQWAG